MTAQAHEHVIIDGEATTMMTCPPLPQSHPRILYAGPPGSFKLKEGVPSVVFSTACWRGYIGTWELKEGRLYLVNLQGSYEVVGGGPVPADWVSGWIRAPRGELLEYVHMGFESVYEEELQVRFEDGVEVERRVVVNGRKGEPRPEEGWRSLLDRLLRPKPPRRD
ncbi:MAG TPA: hypothetical protein VF621_11880 [Pyrinomonadaceae bacterium]